MTDLLIKLIPLFPLLAVILNGLVGMRYSHEVAHRLAWGSVGFSFLCTIGVFADILLTGTPMKSSPINGFSAATSRSISPIS